MASQQSQSQTVPPGEKLASYGEFWPFYLNEHRKPATRSLHYVGTAIGLTLLAIAISTQTWWIMLAALISGYAFAWLSHAFIEHNRPATFTYPFWSLISDFRMFFLWLSGRLGPELSQHLSADTPAQK